MIISVSYPLIKHVIMQNKYQISETLKNYFAPNRTHVYKRKIALFLSLTRFDQKWAWNKPKKVGEERHKKGVQQTVCDRAQFSFTHTRSEWKFLTMYKIHCCCWSIGQFEFNIRASHICHFFRVLNKSQKIWTG